MKLMYKNRGSVSILLIIILLPMLTLSGIIIDYARINLAKSMVDGAGELAMNAGLANYDSVLQDVYGLFAMSQLEDNPELALQRNLQIYFENTLISNGIMSAGEAQLFASGLVNDLLEGDHSNFMEMDISDFSAGGVENSSLVNPQILKKQIVEYMKYRGPMIISSNFLNGMDAFSKLGKQAEVTESKLEVVDQLGKLQKVNLAFYESIQAHDKAFDSYLNSNIDVDYELSEISKKLTTSKEGVSDYDTLIGRILCYPVDLEGSRSTNKSLTYANVTSHNEAAIDLASSLEQAYSKHKNQSTLIKDDQAYKPLLDTVIDVSTRKGISLFEQRLDVSRDYLEASEEQIKDKDELIGKKDPEKDADKISELMSEIDELTNYISEVEEQVSELEQLNEAYNELARLLKRTEEDAVVRVNELLNHLKRVKSMMEILETLRQTADDAALKGKDVYLELNSLEMKRIAYGDQINDYDSHGSNTDTFSASMRADLSRLNYQVSATEVDKILERVLSNYEYFQGLLLDIGENSYRKGHYFRGSQLMYDDINDFVNVYEQGLLPVSYLKIDYEDPDEKVAKISGLPKLGYYSYLKKEFEKIAQEKDVTTSNEISSSIGSNNEKLDGSEGSWSEPSKDETSDTSDRVISKVSQPPLPIDVDQSEPKMSNTNAEIDDDFDRGSDVSASGSFNSQAGIVKTLASNIAQIGLDARNNIYIMEYVFNTLTCDTSGLDLEEGQALLNIANYEINDASNYLYRGEIEYLLYGKDSIKENVQTAKTHVFAVRLVANSIFAFTDGEVKTQTLAGATSISAATGGFVPIPLIQAILQLSLAMAESVVDLNNLSSGEAVVLFKTRDTWSMSLSGMVEYGRTTVKEFAETQSRKAIANISERITKLKDLSLKELGKELLSLKGELINDLKAKAIGLANSYFDIISVEIEGCINGLFIDENGQIIDVTKYDGEDIKSLVRKEFNTALEMAYDELFKLFGNDENPLYMGLLNQVKSEVDVFIQGKVNELLDNSVLSDIQSVDDLLTTFNQEMVGYIEEFIKAMDETIKIFLADQILLINEEFDSYMKMEAEDIEERLTEFCATTIDDNFDKLDNLLPTEKSALSEKADTSGHSMKTMYSFDYEDYLRLFFFINVSLNEETTMKRLATLIQTNINTGEYVHKGAKVSHLKADDNSFDMNQAYTYVTIESSIVLKPLFIDMSLFDQFRSDEEEGKNSIQVIKYKGLSGY